MLCQHVRFYVFLCRWFDVALISFCLSVCCFLHIYWSPFSNWCCQIYFTTWIAEFLLIIMHLNVWSVCTRKIVNFRARILMTHSDIVLLALHDVSCICLDYNFCTSCEQVLIILWIDAWLIYIIEYIVSVVLCKIYTIFFTRSSPSSSSRASLPLLEILLLVIIINWNNFYGCYALLCLRIWSYISAVLDFLLLSVVIGKFLMNVLVTFLIEVF